MSSTASEEEISRAGHNTYVRDATIVRGVRDGLRTDAGAGAKQDLWQRDILSRFEVKSGNAIREMHFEGEEQVGASFF